MRPSRPRIYLTLMEDLAEQAVDDLADVEDLDDERAAAVIMAARAHWFENEEEAS